LELCQDNVRRSSGASAPIRDKNGQLTSTTEEKAAVLLDYYCPEEEEPALDDFTADLETEIEEGLNSSNDNPLNQDFTEFELADALQPVKGKSMGSDLIHNTMLHKLNAENRKVLLYVLNPMFRYSFVPKDWRISIVVPILKPNKPADRAESYRPISLTSCLGKAMEIIINNRLKWHMERHNLLPKEQAGFRKGFSTSDHIMRLETAGNAGFTMNKITVSVFLDFCNAYPKTWLTGLLAKLARAKIRGLMLSWIRIFFTRRWILVRLLQTLSRPRRTKKGIPQGCGPTIWNLFMADFPLPVSGRSSLSKFADDVKFSTTVDTIEEAEKELQPLLNRAGTWAARWTALFSQQVRSDGFLTPKRPSLGSEARAQRITHPGRIHLQIPWDDF